MAFDQLEGVSCDCQMLLVSMPGFGMTRCARQDSGLVFLVNNYDLVGPFRGVDSLNGKFEGWDACNGTVAEKARF